jgi:hypothetical protein
MENNIAVPQKIKADLPCDTAVLLLGIHPKKMKTVGQTGFCSPMFTVALSTMTKKCKQPK